MSRRSTEAAFSLVEALVALAVFAMAGVALVQLQTQSLRTLMDVETRALAGTIAQNRLTQILAAHAQPGLGVRHEEAAFAGRAWRVEIAVAGGGAGRVRRVGVSVAPGEGGPPAARAQAFFMAREDAP